MAFFGRADESIGVMIQTDADLKGVKKTSAAVKGMGTDFDKVGAKTVAFGIIIADTLRKAGRLAAEGFKASTGAAFGQVKAVEEASFALKAYEKDAGKVDEVLKNLVAFARSDTGVLFQRQDLFDAASTLKLYGEETDNLTDRVKILSKGVSAGKTTFQELSQIIGRAAAKGRLDAVDFDMLIERGIGLDRSFRGAKVTADELYDELNRALPDELLVGRANTIEGKMIRLQSSFRDVGLEILGVDKETSKFIEGGLGDRFMKGITAATEVLREMGPAIGDIIGSTIDFAEKAVNLGVQVGEFLQPKLAALWNTVKDDLIPVLADFWKNYLEPLVPVIGVVLVAAIGLAVDAANLFIVAFSGIVDWINNNKAVFLIFIGLFTTLAIKMKFGAIVAAFNASMASARGAMLVTQGSVAALNASLVGFTGFAVIAAAAAAAVVQIVRVFDAYQELKRINAEVTRTDIASIRAGDDYIASVERAVSRGELSRAEADRRITTVTGRSIAPRSITASPGETAIPQFASGGNPPVGQPSLVGEEGPELFVPRSSGTIIPARQTAALRQDASGITYNYGDTVVNLSTPEAVRAYFDMTADDSELVERGLTPARGMI